jgi:hypothetical protein
MSLRSITAAASVAATLAGCGSAGASAVHSAASPTGPSRSGSATASVAQSSTRVAVTTTAVASARPPASRAPADHYPAALTPHWQVISTVGGRAALWIEQRFGVTLVRINQRLAHIALHAGSIDPGGSGWRYGDHIGGRELRHLILGFNGGFKFVTASGGFSSFGRTAVPLAAGRASIVTYRDGITDIGAWQAGVPAHGRPVASVRQNLSLLVDAGRAVPASQSCGVACWGATIGGASVVARSGLGIQRNGRLIWAAGADLSVSQLAAAMVGVGVRRGLELDINPDWVAGYLYVHRHHVGLDPVPVVPGQYGIVGHLLRPYSRDFFTVLSN